MLMIQGARAAVMTATKRDDPTSRWPAQLTQRVGWQKASVSDGQQERTHPVGSDDARHEL
jgi:hypothetical protein